MPQRSIGTDTVEGDPTKHCGKPCCTCWAQRPRHEITAHNIAAWRRVPLSAPWAWLPTRSAVGWSGPGF